MPDKLNKDREILVSFCLRSGLATVFFYAAISAFLDPTSWQGFIPQFVQNIIDPKAFLHLHSAGEIILGLWLLSNKKTFYASVLAALSMLAIVVFNIGALDIIFRDVAILLSAVALAVLSYNRN